LLERLVNEPVERQQRAHSRSRQGGTAGSFTQIKSCYDFMKRGYAAQRAEAQHFLLKKDLKCKQTRGHR
jgi:hypothetical protein